MQQEYIYTFHLIKDKNILYIDFYHILDFRSVVILLNKTTLYENNWKNMFPHLKHYLNVLWRK